jgi:hypothetical protein
LFALALGVAGCGGGGRLELVLDLPENGDLRPAGMTTVTVVAQPFSGDPVETTSVIAADDTFQAGDLPAGEPVAIQVELRDATGRLVGYGRALAPVELSVDEITQVRIAVRRPFLYAASSAGLFTFDPTRDSIDPMYQGRLSPPAPLRTVPLGGDQLAVVRSTEVDLIATEDHQVAADPIGLAATANDAAPVPGQRRVVLGMTTGFVIVDLETGEVRPVDTGGKAIARVTVGIAEDGRTIAYGLVNPVAVPEVDEACASAAKSELAMIDLAAPDAVAFRTLDSGLADLAAGVDAPGLVGAAPCSGELVLIEPAGESQLATLSRAASVAIQGTRVWGAGTDPAQIRYTGPDIDYVEDDAIELLTFVDLRGGGPTQFTLGRNRETMIDMDDPAHEHAQVMKPMSALPLDLVVLAGGEFVAVATRYMYHSNALTSGITIVLPQMDATTSDLILVDGATLTAAQRIRTDCDLTTGQADIFPNWECGAPDEAEVPRLGTFEPSALGALFGAR